MATISIILDWSALWLTRDLGLTIALGGTGIMAFNIAEIGARIYGERLINRFGEGLVAGWGMVIGCLIFLAATLSGNPYLIVAGFGSLGFFTANFIPILFGIAAREETDNPIAAVNDVNLLAFVGFLFGPPADWLYRQVRLHHGLYADLGHNVGVGRGCAAGLAQADATDPGGFSLIVVQGQG